MFLRVLLFKEGIRSRQFYINYANANKNIQASVTKRLFSSVSVLNSNSSDANPCAGLDATNYSLSQSLNPTTSILKRYQQFQQDHPEHLILMQVGDFYEIYGSPVAAAAKILEIAITRTPGKLTSPMTGFPVRSFDTFLGKLVRAGISVVVADQVEMVNGTGRFDRQVTRIITPGTLLEENLLDPARNNFILCLDPVKKSCAWMDVSTGDFFTTTCEKESALISLLACLKPREILVEEGNDVLSSEIKSLFNRSQTFLTKLSKSKDNEIEIEKLTQNSESDSEFPLTQIELKLSCKLLNFVKNSLRSTLSAVKPLKRFAPAKHFMAIDADSFRSLDILFASNSSEKSSNSNNSHSLFTTLNECKTALGSRLLARKLQAPLLDPFQINSALDRVESLIGQGENTLASFRRKLDEVGDIERILQRLCLRRPQGVSRDLRSLARSLISATEALNILSVTDNNTTKPRVNRTLPLSESLLAHLKKISEAFNEKLPLRDSDGGLFLPKWDFKLDELRRLRDDSSAVFSELAASYRQSTGIPNLRIIPFKGDQQVVEVSKSTILPSDIFRPLMQTETRARYTTEELLTKSLLLRTISERVIDHELVLLNSLLEPLIVNSAEIRAAADSIALIDLDSSFALLAIKQDYTRPIINNEAHLDILDGRHPVLDKLFSNPLESTDTIRYFTPNSLSLNEESKFLLLTGPNMGGKSTFLRQNALIVIMAQCGSFVPARSCSLSPVDAIFTRIGASDDLSKDKSTFMLEMSETAHILANSTSRSLVLIDEIGRGTSASEGLALAAAITKHLIHINQARVLFATHYHELINCPLLKNDLNCIQLACTDAEVYSDGRVILIPKVKLGVATHSYALPVASLAGIPSSVIQDAKSHLELSINK